MKPIQWLRFGVMGGALFALDTAVFVVLVYLGWPMPLANAAGMLAGWLAGLFGHQRWTFAGASAQVTLGMALRHAMVLGVNWCLGTLVLVGLVALGWLPVWSKVLATALVTVCSFWLSRRFVFVK